MTAPRIAVWPSDEAGCGHYRLLYPAWLAARDADVIIDQRGPTINWDVNWEGTARPPAHANALGLAEPYPYDIVVMQRPASIWWSQIIPHLKAQGVRIVVDVDDLFDALHPGHVSRRQFERRHHNHSWIDQACQMADLVTATTPALLSRYGYGHGRLLPNLVPRSYLRLKAAKVGRSVGWTGHSGTHPGDLEATGGQVGRVLAGRWDWQWRTVGFGHETPARLRLDARTPITDTGWVAFDEYPRRYAELDIAVVPLEDSLFNRAKSALKMIEAAALGVPVVASPTPDNARMHKAGVGVLADSPGAWRKQLTRLVASDEARADLAGRGREVMGGHTYEGHYGRWVDAWSSVVENVRSAA